MFWIHVYGKTGFEMTSVGPHAVHKFLTVRHWQTEADELGLGIKAKL